MHFSSENGVITVAIDTGSADVSTGIQFLKFSYNAEQNRYVVLRHPFRPDIAISSLSLAPDFSNGYVCVHFRPPVDEPDLFEFGSCYFFSSRKPAEQAFLRCDREQVNQYEPACVHAPCFVSKDSIAIIS